MKSSGLILASLAALSAAFAEDPTKLDPAQRNADFAPAATITPDKRVPQVDTKLQTKRVEPPVIERKDSTVTGQRAPIAVGETREKNIVDKQSTRPEAAARQLSAFDHQESRVHPGVDTEKPPMVARYQDSIAAASASNMARFPALDSSTRAKINRFVFRKNNPDPTLPAGPVTPAASQGALGPR